MKLFPVSDIPAGDGKEANIFLQCKVYTCGSPPDVIAINTVPAVFDRSPTGARWQAARRSTRTPAACASTSSSTPRRTRSSPGAPSRVARRGPCPPGRTRRLAATTAAAWASCLQAESSTPAACTGPGRSFRNYAEVSLHRKKRLATFLSPSRDVINLIYSRTGRVW
jgi:hypothetical protein